MSSSTEQDLNQPKQGIFSRITSSPLTVALVSGFCGIVAGAFSGGYFAPKAPTSVNAVPQNTEQISRLTSRIQELETENRELHAQTKVAQIADTAKQASPYVESFAIPNGQFMGVADHRYIVTVKSITDGVGEIGVTDVRDRDGFIDKKFVMRGSSLRLKSDALECTLKISDVLPAAINMATECTDKS